MKSGTVYTETVIFSAPEAFTKDVPYQTAIVTLATGGRVTGRVIGERVVIGDSGGSVARARRRSCIYKKVERNCRSDRAASGARIKVEAFAVSVCPCALEAQGRSVIHLEIGEPDFPTPPHIVEAAKQALDEGWTHYGPTQGLPALRESIARHVSATRGIEVGSERVSVVPGGKPIIFFPILALLEPGDEAIYPDPGFPIYESMIRFTGATPVAMPLEESRGFSFDLDLFRSRLTDRTRMVILNSPGKSHWRRDPRSRPGGAGGVAAGPRPDRAER